MQPDNRTTPKTSCSDEKTLCSDAKSGNTSLHSIPNTQIKTSIRNNQASSDLSTEANHQEGSLSRSVICAQEEMLSVQTDLCNDVSKKLRVKSDRGMPRKVSNVLRNPFEIGIKFKGKRRKRGIGKVGAKNRRAKQIRDSYLQLVPAGLVGRSVKEALEIISSAENMGLVIKGDREEVVKAIARRLESGEL